MHTAWINFGMHQKFLNKCSSIKKKSIQSSLMSQLFIAEHRNIKRGSSPDDVNSSLVGLEYMMPLSWHDVQQKPFANFCAVRTGRRVPGFQKILPTSGKQWGHASVPQVYRKKYFRRGTMGGLHWRGGIPPFPYPSALQGAQFLWAVWIPQITPPATPMEASVKFHLRGRR